MDQIVIDLYPIKVNDIKHIPQELSNKKEFLFTFISIGLLIIFTLLSIAQTLPWKPLDNFLAFQDIQRNFNKWNSIISQYQILESNKIVALKPSMSNYNRVMCVDYGTFYIPIFFNDLTLNGESRTLPAAIRRGNGDGWTVTKSSNNDTAAYQQCLYVASEYIDSVITCGTDMYNKLGYGGYLNSGHWCNTARDKLYQLYHI